MTKLDVMNLLNRFLFNETVEDVQVYNNIIEIPQLNDGARCIFINTKGTDPKHFSKEFFDFMGYINASADAIAMKVENQASVIRNMLRLDYSIDTIAQCVGISTEEIVKISKENI